jgi:RND family efflux transporter MFP subunit
MAGTALIYSLQAEDRGRAEAEAWAAFSTAQNTAEFCASWLAILCTQVERVSSALLLLGPNEKGAFTPAAVWPDPKRDMQHLAAAGKLALTERRGVVVGPDSGPPSPDKPAYVGYPIEVSGELHGAVVLDIEPVPELALQRALRLLHWASAWLVAQFREEALRQRDATLARMGLANDLVATALQESRFTPSALAVANELAGQLQCDRVSIGIADAHGVQVKAISHTASFDRKTALVRLIGEAMDEVIDLDSVVVHPPRDGEELGGIAHAELAREFKHDAICSVPLLQDGHTFGVITLERSRGEPFDAAAVEVCKTAGMLLGPILALQQEAERGVLPRLRDGAAWWATALFGPRHPGIKLLAVLAVAVIAVGSFATATYRVSAKTVIEGAVQRAAVAPFDGYVAQSMVRAGDAVKQGDILCRLDDRDLKLERTRLLSEREQLVGKRRQAMASEDRAAMAVIAAQIEQSEAQLSLVQDKLARATLVAPFDGVVVSGDLSQLLGTPVEQGKMLFQVAPLDAYRVILEVDEADIDQVRPGQQGELALSGNPGHPLRIHVKQVTPVSTPQEGHNFFRVEARLDSPSAHLRPGMEGVGKVTVGSRKLLWIWTHGLVDWLRLWAWKSLP